MRVSRPLAKQLLKEMVARTFGLPSEENLEERMMNLEDEAEVCGGATWRSYDLILTVDHHGRWYLLPEPPVSPA